MKKTICLILAIAVLLTLVACDSDTPEETADPSAEDLVSGQPSAEPPVETEDPPAEGSSLADRIEELLEILIADPDDKAVWRNPAEAIEIDAMGGDALAYFLPMFEDGVIGGDPRAGIIMALCREILVGEDVNLITDRPDYWYEMFKGRVLRLRDLNTAAEMAERYPLSSVLLAVLGIPESAPLSPPASAEVPDLEDYDPEQPLADSEFVLFNGVRFGMTMAEVLAITGEDVEFIDPAFPENQAFTYAGVFYGCHEAEGEDVFVLTTVSINDPAHPAVRGIRFGDTIESVFDKFPVRDRELKHWAWQMLYGTMPEEDEPHRNYAAMEFVAGSFYSIRVLAEEYVLNLSFSRAEQKVITLTMGRIS